MPNRKLMHTNIVHTPAETKRDYSNVGAGFASLVLKSIKKESLA